MDNWRIPARCLWAEIVAARFLAAAAGLAAGEFLPSLKLGSEVHGNVTVTSITATDMYFRHAQAMGNAKLKHLEAEE